jgi:hypothetical protein
MGAATVVLALLALLLRQRDGKQASSDPGSETAQSDRGPSWIGSVEQGKPTTSSSLPRFTPRPEKPGERHSQALLIKQKARANGSRIPGSAELYDAEGRDPVWAPAMERILTDRFRQDQEALVAAGLKTAKIQDPECHTSTCRFEIHYPEQELAQAREAGVFSEKLAPSGYLFQNTGPFARSWSDNRTEPIEVVDGVTRMKQIVYIVFGEAESDPGSYAAWVADARREMAHQSSLGSKVPTKGLPPALLNVR